MFQYDFLNHVAYVLIAGHSRFGFFLEFLNWRISGCFMEQEHRVQ